MRIARQLLATMLCAALLASAQGNSWDKVRYNGGTVQTKVGPKDWGNRLTITSDRIALKLKDGQALEIPTSAVTGLSYGQEAHRRVGTMVALAFLTPLALFGLFHKTRLHFIGIEYKTLDGKGAGLLLQGDKNNYRAILVALKGATGAPLAVSEKDREFVPAGVQTKVVKESEGEKAGESKDKGAAPAKEANTGTISVSSTPDNAEISVDGAFMGNTPATLKLTPGKHTIRVVLTGYKEWTKEITVLAGSEVRLAAVLEKQN